MIAVPRTTTKDPTPPMGVDVNDVRGLHVAINRHRRTARAALYIALIALAMAAAAIVLVLTKGS